MHVYWPTVWKRTRLGVITSIFDIGNTQRVEVFVALLATTLMVVLIGPSLSLTAFGRLTDEIFGSLCPLAKQSIGNRLTSARHLLGHPSQLLIAIGIPRAQRRQHGRPTGWIPRTCKQRFSQSRVVSGWVAEVDRIQRSICIEIRSAPLLNRISIQPLKRTEFCGGSNT